MNIFIVYAHPEPQSFCHALLEHSIKSLTDMGHQVRISDLYAQSFNPIAGKHDFGARSNDDYLVYALEQRHNYKNGTLAEDIQAEIEKLLWCDLIIFHFPLYWFSVPAILKGWIDRVFISGLTYGGLRFYDDGGLKGKSGMLTVTLGARESMFGADGIHGDLQDMVRHLLRGTLYYVGLRVLPPFFAYHIPYITDEERRVNFDKYDSHLQNLDRLSPLSFPSVKEFSQKIQQGLLK